MTDLTILGEDEGVTRTDAPRMPESLLAPLLDVAGDLLRSLSAAEVPLQLRPLAGFDPDWAPETFAISPDGRRICLAEWEQVSSLMTADGVPGVERAKGAP